MVEETSRTWLATTASLLFSLLICLIGVILSTGGLWLILLGGSPYYLIAGAGVLAAGGLLARGDATGGVVFGVIALLTLPWALWEAGLSFWPLFPRVFSPVVIGLGVVFRLLAMTPSARRRRALQISGAGVVLGALLLVAALVPQFSLGQAQSPALAVNAPAPSPQTIDWRYYGRDPGGSRYAPYAKITPANIDHLKVAWTIHTGDIARLGSEDQDTPSQIGDTVYICTPRNIVIAVDADTGAERWRHDPKVKPGFWNRCRGVGYYDGAAGASANAAKEQTGASALCATRIISTTIDARLYALDAKTGTPCPGFGHNGLVNLSDGMGLIKKGFYFPTSAPTVVDGLIVVGGWVVDNIEVGEPSGVVRAFSAETGDLVWAWDLGNPAITKSPPAGQTYTRATPNVWSTPAFDPALDLIYLPTGNGTPDYWGSHRSDATEKYASSIVALEARTGKERWRFQTVHHDLWDYDVPSEPMLVDFPDETGHSTPALIQLTKRGQTFVLDRRTGRPLVKVVERPAPRTTTAGEWTAPTQPYSVGMPAINADRLTEAKMWGTTPIDQMICRIIFRSDRYEGDFTPPGLKPGIEFPGDGGGQNWGGGAYDPGHRYLIVTGMSLPTTVTLFKSKRPAMQVGLAPYRSPRIADPVAYDAKVGRYLSPLFVPCMQPPLATMTAIDLTTRKIIWQVPTGSAEASGPLGMKSGLPIPLGTPGLGGPITTASGLVFHAATTDPYLRAYDAGTGKVVWRSRLPVGVGGTPMSYVSPSTGRQYVVVTAGGARSMPERGDYVIAYALK